MPPKARSSRGKRRGGVSGEGGGGTPSSWTHEQAVTALNDAKLSGDAKGTAKLNELAELVLLKDPGLLDEFAPALLEMRVDPNAAVRKTIAGFSERIAGEASRQIASCASCATALLHDPTPAVVKAAVKASAAIFREALVETALKGEGPRVPKDVRETWKLARLMIDDVKHLVLEEKTNDGVRLQATRCLESVILLFHGRGWGAGVVQSGHAVIDLDALATEADGLVGVLLESLQPEQCAKQAGTTTVVMIASAAHAAKQLPAYSDFVLPALCALADAYGEKESGESERRSPHRHHHHRHGGFDPEGASFGVDGGAAGWRARDGAAPRRSSPRCGRAGGDGRRRRSRRWTARRRKREREREPRSSRRRSARRSDGARRRTRRRRRRARARGGGGGGSRRRGALAVTPRHLLDRVLGTIAHLSTTNRPALDGFVAQLAPEVLADVVLANVGAIDRVAGRVVVDVRAGMGAGVEGWIDRAVDTDARGMDETTRRGEDRSGVGGPGAIGPGSIGGGAGPSGSLGASSDASAGGPGVLPPPPPPKPPKAAKPFERAAAGGRRGTRAPRRRRADARRRRRGSQRRRREHGRRGAPGAALLRAARDVARLRGNRRRGEPRRYSSRGGGGGRTTTTTEEFLRPSGSWAAPDSSPPPPPNPRRRRRISPWWAPRAARLALRALSTPTAAGRKPDALGGVAGALLEYLVASLPDPRRTRRRFVSWARRS